MERLGWHVDEDIRVAESLPPATFREPAFLEAEYQTLFPRYWALATPGEGLKPASHLPRLAEPAGTRLPVSSLGAPYYLHRGADQTLRGFPNVCTHAWHTLVTRPSTGKTVACPQHGRTFDDHGRFVSQPGIENDLPDFPRDCDHLRARRADTWGPLMFLAGNEARPPLAAALEPVTLSLGQLPLDQLKPVTGPNAVRTVLGNWKQHAGNYLDSLHIPYVHGGGGLAAAIHLDSYETEIHRDSVLQWAYAKRPELGFEPDLLPDRFQDPKRRVFALWWFVFPNLALNFYPWGLSVNAYVPKREDPTRTQFHWYRYTWDDALANRMEDWHMAGVDEEDVTALDYVTDGLGSPDAVRGRFAPDAEQAPHWFQRKVYEALASA